MGDPSWSYFTMHTCLFTDEPLNADTKVEHTILQCLGGRVTSKRVTSSSFNERCSSTIDTAVKRAYWPIMSQLAPALCGRIRSEGIGVETPNHVGNYRINKMGEFEHVGVDVIRDEQGRPVSIVGSDIEEVRRLGEKLGLTNIRMEDPKNADVTLAKIPSVNPALEVGILKCILLTFDERLCPAADRFTRSEKLAACRDIVRQFVQDRLETAESTELRRVSLGLQYEAEYRGRYEKIMREADLPVKPFSHQLIVSSDSDRRTLDAVFIAFGEDPHAFRLCREWDGPCWTLAMTNGILANETASPIVRLSKSWTLGKCNNRQSFVRFTPSREKPNMEKINEEISEHRFAIIARAMIYRQQNCDQNVIEQIKLSALARWNGDRNVADAILDRLMSLFDAENMSEERSERFVDAIHQEIDAAPHETIGVVMDSPFSGWDFWLALYRRCFLRLLESLGRPGRISVQRSVIIEDGIIAA